MSAVHVIGLGRPSSRRPLPGGIDGPTGLWRGAARANTAPQYIGQEHRS
jgi:hypothetical protein